MISAPLKQSCTSKSIHDPVLGSPSQVFLSRMHCSLKTKSKIASCLSNICILKDVEYIKVTYCTNLNHHLFKGTTVFFTILVARHSETFWTLGLLITKNNQRSS